MKTPKISNQTLTAASMPRARPFRVFVLSMGLVALFMFSMTVLPNTEIRTLRTVEAGGYYIPFARPISQQNLPEITLHASSTKYVAGLEALVFTVTRTGDTAAELDLTINITQEQEWLTDTSYDVIIPANLSAIKFRIPAPNFSSDVTESGNLTATVSPVSGYDTSRASVQVRMISQEGPAVKIALDMSQYTVDEGSGEFEFFLVARSVPDLQDAGGFTITVSALADGATFLVDYGGLRKAFSFADTQFSKEGEVLVARRPVTMTIVDDNIYEGNESFALKLSRDPRFSEVSLLDPDGNSCLTSCDNDYPVTIIDNDVEPVLGLSVSPYGIKEAGKTSATITLRSVTSTSLPFDQTITFDFGGAATLGQDYTVSPADADTELDGHQAVLDARATVASLIVTAVDDSEEESCEWITVSAVLAEDSTPIPRERTIAILDDDNTSPDPNPSSICLNNLLKRPGISVPKRQSSGVSMFWQTREFGQAEAPDGWKVERRHRGSTGWIVRTFIFIGVDADVLQTYNEEYWDWVDRTADLTIDYTYRVRAINADGSDTEDRIWSRRAPVE